MSSSSKSYEHTKFARRSPPVHGVEYCNVPLYAAADMLLLDTQHRATPATATKDLIIDNDEDDDDDGNRCWNMI